MFRSFAVIAKAALSVNMQSYDIRIRKRPAIQGKPTNSVAAHLYWGESINYVCPSLDHNGF
jgi:hypothetical protein